MNRKIVIELLEKHNKVTFYTYRFVNDSTTEFNKFYDANDNNPKFDADLNNILMWIEKIGNTGAFERNFRREKNRLGALPTDNNKLRLYCYRISDRIVILGNGGHKKTRTYNEDPLLNDFAETLFSIGNILMSLLKKAQINEYNQELYNLPKTISIYANEER